MPADIFAKLGDIKGESGDAKHKDEIEVLSFSWGVTNTVPPGTGGGGGDGQSNLQRPVLRAPHRQGVSPAAEGLRHRHSHQGGDHHPP